MRNLVHALTGLCLASLALAASLPATMTAVRIHAFGDASALRVEEVPVPKPQRGELLVRVNAAGVNPVDWKAREGRLGSMMGEFPVTLGFDVAGSVVSLGDSVEGFEVGDPVYAYLPLSLGGGYAQYARVPASAAAKKPNTIDFDESAGVPLAALTAWQALFEHAELQPGQTVLIHAGAGGVGHFAVQLAKWKGAKVITTASERNHEFLRSLGADEIIDYRATNFWEVVENADVVLDAVGGDTLARSYEVVRPGGILVTIAGRPDPQALEARAIRGKAFLVRPDGKQLAEIGALIDAGTVRPHISDMLPLAEAARAQEMSESGRTRGKIVLIVP